jgi:hypothetical protein
MQYIAGGWIPPQDMRDAIAAALNTKAETLWPLVTNEVTDTEHSWGDWARDDEIVVDE